MKNICLKIIVYIMTITFSIIYSTITPLQNSLPFVSRYNHQLIRDIKSVYEKTLFKIYSNPRQYPTVISSILAVNAFKIPLFSARTPFDQLSHGDSQLLLAVLSAAHHDISSFSSQPLQGLTSIDEPLKSNFQEILNIIENRYSLAKIEDAAINNQGFLGNEVLTNIPNNTAFRDTINSLTGRIFVIKNINKSPTIISISSGMIIPYKEGNGTKYDRVITCCHSMETGDSSPDLEFYFVSSEALDANSGLPASSYIHTQLTGKLLKPSQLKKVNASITIQHFISYLRTSSKQTDSHVRRIEKFIALEQQISELKHHAPRYSFAKDCGYGLLNKSFYFPRKTFTKIRLLNKPPPGAYTYHAIGYPGFSHYDTNNENFLIQQLGFAPLTMTTARSDEILSDGKLILSKMTNGRLRHGAPTMKGMSGGPILRFNPQNTSIDIFGVITSGFMDFNHACTFK